MAWFNTGLRFTCTQCGNCCTGPTGYVRFTGDEAERMARHLGIPLQAFYDRYAEWKDGAWSLGEVWNPKVGGFDCVFLEWSESGQTARCSLYEARPTQCRTWPFWPENLRSPRAWRRAARGCPGIAAGEAGKGDYYPPEQIRIIRDQTPEGL